MSIIVWIALGTLATILALVTAWWLRASRARCPIDGSIRCRNCTHGDDDVTGH